MNDLTQITQLTGVGVAGLSVFLIYKLATNELRHLTDVINELTVVIKRLENWLEKHHEKTE